MRKFVRHPSSIPIELSIARGPCGSGQQQQLRNISGGGFSCLVDEPLPIGSRVQLRIPKIWPDYRGCGTVVWCSATPPAFEVGIEFGAADLFKAKMVEQLCQIEQYRQQVQADEGRTLDSEQAASEWIALYAKEFAEQFPAQHDGPA